jgi:hypothetical protein
MEGRLNRELGDWEIGRLGDYDLGDYKVPARRGCIGMTRQRM